MNHLRLRRLEWALVWRDATVLTATVLLALMGALAIATGLARVEARQEALVSMEAAQHEDLDRYRELARQADAGAVAPAAFRDPRNPGAYGRRMLSAYAAMDTLPSSMLSVGQGDLAPWYFKVNTDTRDKAASAYELANPHRLQVGDFDFAFVLIWLFPLMAITVGHSVATQERERGLDRLVALSTVSPVRLYLGRLSRRIWPLIVVLWGAEALAFALASRIFSAPGEALLRELGIWWAMTFVYAAFWWLCIAALSARAHTRRNALVDLAGLWFALVLLVPLLAAISVEWVHPMPSRPVYVMALRDAAEEAARDKATALRLFAAEHPFLAEAALHESATLPGDGIQLAVATRVDAANRRLTEPFEETRRAQERWAQGWAVVSPAILLQGQIERLAGADLARQANFVRQVDAHRERLRGVFAQHVLRQSPWTLTQFELNVAVPRFRYVPYRSCVATGADFLAWVVLLGMAGLGAFLGWRRSRD